MDSQDGISIASGESNSSFAPTNKRVAISEAFDLCGKLIKLVVGEGDERVTLHIHQDVLSRNSEFFKRAIKPEWADMREEPDSIDLSIHSVQDVKTYAHWLYAGTCLLETLITLAILSRTLSGLISLSLMYLARRLWIGSTGRNVYKANLVFIKCITQFADFNILLDQRAILETFAAVQADAPDFPCAEAFVIIYDGTPEGSPARKLLADMYACGAYDAPDWNKEFELLPHEALLDVMSATVRVRRGYYARRWTESVRRYIGTSWSA